MKIQLAILGVVVLYDMTFPVFITSNKGKYHDACTVIKDLKMHPVEVPEIQSQNLKEVLEAKIAHVRKKYEGNFFVEDTALYLDCLHGFPGTFIRWMLSSIGADGIAELVHTYPVHTAQVETGVGVCINGRVTFMYEQQEGVIVDSRGSAGFGYDQIFQPQGSTLTLAQMDVQDRIRFIPRIRIFAALAAKIH